MDRHIEIFKALLLIALLCQIAIDGLGLSGVFYSAYEEEVFLHAGEGALISFEARFSIYLFFIAAFYTSIIAMSLGHWLAWLLIPITLLLSVLPQPFSGVYIGTPAELTLGTIVWLAYDIAIAMVFISPSVSAKFRKSFENFSKR